MLDRLNTTDQVLLDDFQRDFPLVSRPFARIAAKVGIDEDDVLARLAALKRAGAITRVRVGGSAVTVSEGWITVP